MTSNPPTATQAPCPPELLGAMQQPAPATCRAEAVDFAGHGLTEYQESFGVLIRDLLTLAECEALLHAADEAASGCWEPALINAGGHDLVRTDMRLCDRTLWDERELAEALLTRIRPHLPADIVDLVDKPHIVGDEPWWRDGAWRLTRLNERLRFLRYSPGMYFRPHVDGSYITPSGDEVSFLTMHLYLGGSADLAGGATRFYGKDAKGEMRQLDVDPVAGSCLVFQHEGLEHSGEDVRKGTKFTMRTDVMYRRTA